MDELEIWYLVQEPQIRANSLGCRGFDSIGCNPMDDQERLSALLNTHNKYIIATRFNGRVSLYSTTPFINQRMNLRSGGLATKVGPMSWYIYGVATCIVAL